MIRDVLPPQDSRPQVTSSGRPREEHLVELATSPHHLTNYDPHLHFHTSPELERLVAQFKGERALDLGCGDCRGSTWLRMLGMKTLGFDLRGSLQNDVRGDGQDLPFKDSTFRVVLSLKVLEHVRVPSLFLHEAYRVLKSGSLFLGSVAFLEPYHDESYFHFSPMALVDYLSEAGFVTEELQPGHSALASLLSTALPSPKLGLSTSITKPLGGLLQNLLLSLRRVSGLSYARLTKQLERYRHLVDVDDLRFAGEFSFLARRP